MGTTLEAAAEKPKSLWSRPSSIIGIGTLVLGVIGILVTIAINSGDGTGGGGGASVEITPSSGIIAQVRGGGFSASEQVQESLGGSLVNEARATPDGRLWTTFTVPNETPEGTYDVLIRGLSSQKEASGSFLVDWSP